MQEVRAGRRTHLPWELSGALEPQERSASAEVAPLLQARAAAALRCAHAAAARARPDEAAEEAPLEWQPVAPANSNSTSRMKSAQLTVLSLHSHDKPSAGVMLQG